MVSVLVFCSLCSCRFFWFARRFLSFFLLPFVFFCQIWFLGPELLVSYITFCSFYVGYSYFYNIDSMLRLPNGFRIHHPLPSLQLFLVLFREISGPGHTIWWIVRYHTIALLGCICTRCSYMNVVLVLSYIYIYIYIYTYASSMVVHSTASLGWMHKVSQIVWKSKSTLVIPLPSHKSTAK